MKQQKEGPPHDSHVRERARLVSLDFSRTLHNPMLQPEAVVKYHAEIYEAARERSLILHVW